MEKIYICPECHSELEHISACGSESYFCNKCKCLISRSKIVDASSNASKTNDKGDINKSDTSKIKI